MIQGQYIRCGEWPREQLKESSRLASTTCLVIVQKMALESEL